MEKEKRRALGHKAMNLFQIEMFRIDQDSELFETSPKESPGVGTRKAKIFVNEENLLYRIRQFGEDDKIGVLNFANPFVPGGHFMDGENAQEQWICRNSYLFPELRKFRRTYYYKNELDPKNGYISPSLIYSRHVKVLRDEKEDRILPDPRYVDFISVAAPNVNLIRQKGVKFDSATLYSDIFEKIVRVLRVFKIHEDRNLILGAFGCGIFGNDAKMVSLAFDNALKLKEFGGCFDNIYFDIIDNKPAFAAFKKEFGA